MESMEIARIPICGERWNSSGSSIDVVDPYQYKVIGRIPACTSVEIDRAVAQAQDALKRGLPQWQRAKILDVAAARLAARREEFAQLIARESAKPIRTARIEVDRAVGTFEFSAAEARKLAGEMIPMEARVITPIIGAATKLFFAAPARLRPMTITIVPVTTGGNIQLIQPIPACLTIRPTTAKITPVTTTPPSAAPIPPFVFAAAIGAKNAKEEPR